MAKIELLRTFDRVNGQENDFVNSVKTNVTKGHVNKILFTFPKSLTSLKLVQKSKISIKHVSKRVTNLITSMPMHVFMDISNEKYGSVTGSHTTFVNLLRILQRNGLEKNIEDAINITVVNDQISFMVDCGSFILDNGDELHITVDRAGLEGLDIPEMQVSTVSDDVEAHHFLMYDKDYDRNEMHQNVKELYLDATAFKNTNFDIFVDSPGDQYHMTNLSARAYAMLTGKFENEDPTIYKIYESDTPEDVNVKIVDAPDTHDIGVIAVRIKSNIDKYEEEQRQLIGNEAAKLERFEKNDPATAEVLTAASGVSSDDLQVKANEFKKE